MPTVTLKNIPDDLYGQLKDAAQSHHRSLNSEVLHCLERMLGTRKVSADERLRVVRQLREKTRALPLTDELLSEAKNAGRI